MSFSKIFNRQKVKDAIKEDLISAYRKRVIDKLDIHRNTLDPFSAVLDSKLLNKDLETYINDVEIQHRMSLLGLTSQSLKSLSNYKAVIESSIENMVCGVEVVNSELKTHGLYLEEIRSRAPYSLRGLPPPPLRSPLVYSGASTL